MDFGHFKISGAFRYSSECVDEWLGEGDEQSDENGLQCYPLKLL